MIRVGAIVLAVLLVLPRIRKLTGKEMTVIGAGLVLVLIRPGLIWAALVVGVAWLWAGRHRTDDSDS